MSRSYRDKFQKALMDRNCAKICRERSPKVLIDRNLSRIYREAVELDENSFSKRGKTHRNECNQVSYLTTDLNHILSSQKHFSTRKMQSIHKSKTHTHTH